MPNRTEDPFIIRGLEMQHKFSNLNEQISKTENSVKNLASAKAKLSKTNATETPSNPKKNLIHNQKKTKQAWSGNDIFFFYIFI